MRQKLDLYLANKRKWERRSHGLIVDDLDYKGLRYEQRKHRRALLEKLISDLDGKELTNGKLRLEIRQTKDGKDWKLTAFKEKRRKVHRPRLTELLGSADATLLAQDLLLLFDGQKGQPPKQGYLTFLCQHYPEHLLRDAISRAKSDYLGNVRKSVGAVFVYELEQLVKARNDLTWYKDNTTREEN